MSIHFSKEEAPAKVGESGKNWRIISVVPVLGYLLKASYGNGVIEDIDPQDLEAYCSITSDLIKEMDGEGLQTCHRERLQASNDIDEKYQRHETS
jgi:hypothetical protein